ncbi:mitogen-activated protein kinase kinase kinase NPK1-like isoform X2 [Miscanthus floridulus]|uniref:mitogen-activated protein kinase kinase kinase NPK1-like isoform X2 n=2 Tax=Miscanthus floridulus TaxID=154761 RepID=UPI003457490B
MKQSAEENPPIRWWKGNLIGSGAFGKLLAVNQVGMHVSISKVGPLNGENFLSDLMDLGLFSWWLFMIGSSNATRQKAQVIWKYTKQLLPGLKYLQHNGIIHRDIKVSTVQSSMGGPSVTNFQRQLSASVVEQKQGSKIQLFNRSTTTALVTQETSQPEQQPPSSAAEERLTRGRMTRSNLAANSGAVYTTAKQLKETAARKRSALSKKNTQEES